MYVKLHDSIFGSSIMEEDIETRYIWFCMLTLADFEGFVDETIPALARRFNMSEQAIQKAIDRFLQPDPSSRTADNDGRRLEPMRPTFGWHIINYEKYRDMRNAEDRKEYMRRYMRDYLPKYRQGKATKKGDKQNVYQSLSEFGDKHDKPKQKQNKKEIKKESFTSVSKGILAYLNEVGGKKFTPTEANLRPIISRLKEGHTEEECRKVIDIKSRDPDFQDKYFRPVTLFRASKFEGYLNEKRKENVW